MIISASRRTDIPSYYFDWFLHRIREGFVYVRNPMRFHQVSVVSLTPDVVDGIVFWTKNPAPALPYLDALESYPYYFQFTLNPYGSPIETRLPPLRERVLTFQKLSTALDQDRVVWRYDPIIMSETYTVSYHTDAFYRLAKQLSPYTDTCTVSFLDIYRNIRQRIAPFGLRPPSDAEILALMKSFSQIAADLGLRLTTCSETADLRSFGITHACCIDASRLERIGGFSLCVRPDPYQRKGCGCSSSIDIGAYHSCRNGCLYCYANHSDSLLNASCRLHRVDSPLLYGQISPEDVLKPRQMRSNKIH